MSATTKDAVKKLKPPRSKKALLVAVAKDVLKLMRYIDAATSRGYLLRRDHRQSFDTPDDLRGEPAKIQKAIPKIAKECTVCALGAMTLAHIHLYDGCGFIPTNEESEEKMLDLFGEDARRIERAFEKGLDRNTDTEIPAIINKDAKSRLRWIMKNIVTHNGVFTPFPKKERKP
jgi:hypothetical protein